MLDLERSWTISGQHPVFGIMMNVSHHASQYTTTDNEHFNGSEEPWLHQEAVE